MSDGELVDMSLPLRDGMKLFPGLEGFESTLSVDDETGAVTRRFSSSTHQGTHVDAPAHYVDGPTIDDLSLNRWTGTARVVDLREHRGETITAATLDDCADDVDPSDRVILLTGDVDEHFGTEAFFDEAAALAPDAAEWLVDRKVSLVANDFLTESLDDPERPVHHTLLGGGIPIVEYLCNANAIADATTIEFTCYPLYMAGFEASPVRAVARR